MRPINPTPYVLIFIILVFLCPWSVLCTYVIYDVRILSKNNVFSFDLNPIRALRKVSKFREKNDKSKYLNEKVKKWLIITLISWVIGFLCLGITLFLLEKNNLLINHSKGIY